MKNAWSGAFVSLTYPVRPDRRRQACPARRSCPPLWASLLEGRSKGRDLDNWLQAEAELFERTPLNIGESQDGVTVLAEVRDFTPKDLEIDLEPKRVTIIGRGRPQVEQKAGASTDTQKRTVRLLRSVQLPVEIDAAHATARFKGGVIELKLQKTMPGKAGTVKAVSNSNLA